VAVPVAPPKAGPRRRLVVVAATIVVGAALAALLLAPRDSPTAFTVHGTGRGPVNPGPKGQGVTNGGLSSIGRFTISGGVQDQGTYVAYRRVTGGIATVREVFSGTKGTIGVRISIHLGSPDAPPWTVTSGTGIYAGLKASGRLSVDNYDSNPYTFVLTGRIRND
jgi:hypothetical protein